MVMYHHHHRQEGSVGLVLVSALDSYQGSLQYYTTTEPRIVRRKKIKLKRRNIGTMKWKRWRRGELGPKIQKFSSVWQSMDGNNSSSVFQPHFPGALILCSGISLRGEKQPTYTTLETKSKWVAYLVLYLYIKHCFVVSFNVWITTTTRIMVPL